MNTATKTHSHLGYTYLEVNGSFFKGCRRCHGTGHYSFDGFDSLCYLCRNTDAKLGDFISTDEADAIKWCEDKAKAQAKRDAKREEVRLAKLRKRDAAWQALKDEHPMVWDLVSNVLHIAIPFEDGQGGDITERDNFVRSLADKMWKLDQVGYSPRQLEVLQSIAEKRQERSAEAAATPAPAGRVVVSGEIVGTKVVEGDYGTAYKITVKDDRGFRVYVSLPKAQADSAYDEFVTWVDDSGYSLYDFGPACFFLGTQDEKYTSVKGRRITFTATLTPSNDDVSFAFGSRPTKGAWL